MILVRSISQVTDITENQKYFADQRGMTDVIVGASLVEQRIAQPIAASQQRQPQ